MFLLYLIAGYCFLCGTILYVLLMGQDPSNRGTIVGRANNCMRSAPTNILYYFLLLGNRFSRRKAQEQTTYVEDWCYNKPNQLIQIFYAFLVASSLYVFFTIVAPRLPSLTHLLVALAICVISIVCYFMACYVDPGTVTTAAKQAQQTPEAKRWEEVQNRRFKPDGVYYSTTPQDCATCNVPKPARSKHCRLCNRCVRRFDHHCPWINACVGEGNLRWFHAFLLSHVVMSAMIAFWSAWIIQQYIERERLWHARYAPSGTNSAKIRPEEVIYPSTYVVVFFAISQNAYAAGLCLFAGIVALLLLVFWWMNFLHVMRNETTNETHKREDVVQLVKRDEWIARQKKKYEEELEKEKQEHQQQQQQQQQQAKEDDTKKQKDPTLRATTPPPNIPPSGLTREDVDKAKLFYLGSIWANIREVFSPSSVAASPSARGVTATTAKAAVSGGKDSVSVRAAASSSSSSSPLLQTAAKKDGNKKKR